MGATPDLVPGGATLIAQLTIKNGLGNLGQNVDFEIMLIEQHVRFYELLIYYIIMRYDIILILIKSCGYDHFNDLSY